MAKKQKPITKVTSFSLLSPDQKRDIAVWLYDFYHDYYIENGSLPTEPEHHEKIVRRLIGRIKQDRIVIPDKQIELYYNSKQSGMIKRLKKEFPEIGGDSQGEE